MMTATGECYSISLFFLAVSAWWGWWSGFGGLGQVTNELTFAFRVKPNVHCMRAVFTVILHIRSHFGELRPEFDVG